MDFEKEEQKRKAFRELIIYLSEKYYIKENPSQIIEFLGIFAGAKETDEKKYIKNWNIYTMTPILVSLFDTIILIFFPF